MTRPVILSVPHNGTRFAHNFLVHIGMDPLRLIHTGNPDIEKGLTHEFVVPIRDPKLCFLSHLRRKGRVQAWEEALDETLGHWDLMAGLLPRLWSYIHLKIDAPDLMAEFQKVHEYVGGIRPIEGFSCEPIGDYKDFPTTDRLWDFMAPEFNNLDTIMDRLRPYQETYGY